MWKSNFRKFCRPEMYKNIAQDIKLGFGGHEMTETRIKCSR